MKGRLALAVAGVAVLLAAAGCDLGDKVSEPWNDAPRSPVVNDSPADIVTFPDGFSNWATKCDHGNRIYSAFHGDSPYAGGFVVPNAC